MKNAALVFVVHAVSDLNKFAHRDLLLENCMTKIFLPNSEAINEDLAPHYRGIGLSTRQIERLATAMPKRDYYVVSRDGRRLVSLELGPVALSFVAVNGRDERHHLGVLQQQYGQDWPALWLREPNLLK